MLQGELLVRMMRMDRQSAMLFVATLACLYGGASCECDAVKFSACIEEFEALEDFESKLLEEEELENLCRQFFTAQDCVSSTITTCDDIDTLQIAWRPLQAGLTYWCSEEGKQGHLDHGSCLFNNARAKLLECQADYENGYRQINLNAAQGKYSTADEIYNASCSVVVQFLECSCEKAEEQCDSLAASHHYTYVGQSLAEVWTLFDCSRQLSRGFPSCGDHTYIIPPTENTNASSSLVTTVAEISTTTPSASSSTSEARSITENMLTHSASSEASDPMTTPSRGPAPDAVSGGLERGVPTVCYIPALVSIATLLWRL